MRELLTERAGTSDGGGFFALNPPVTDLLPRFSLTQDGISLLVMGTVERPGGGCVCPESAVLRALTRHLVGLDDTALVMDLEAGLEHLGRGTAQYMDRLLIVTEPTPASVRTTRRIAELAAGLGLRTVAVGNKIRDEAAAEFVRAGVAPIPLAGLLPYDPVIEQAYRGPTPPSSAFSAAIAKLLAGLEGSS
jgi:CO dehydrogenase maturation factor